MEKTAWKEDMIILFILASKATTWVFIAIFKISPAIPKKNKLANKLKELLLKLMMGMMIMYKKTARMHITLELNFEISQPAIGNDTREPKGKPIKTLPNCASDRFKKYLKSGIRVAQVAKFNPHKKNKIPMLRRFLTNSLMIVSAFLLLTRNLPVHIHLNANYAEP